MYWVKQMFFIQKKHRQEWTFIFLLSTFRLHQGLKLSFEHKSDRKNLTLVLVSVETFLSERDQKIKFGGNIV